MPRHNIDRAGVRDRLQPRREPYWGSPIARGLFVGFRKLEAGWGTWIARWRDDEGRQRYRSLGPVSDALDYETARRDALAWLKQAAAGVDASEVRTVADACREYVDQLKKAKGEASGHDADMRFRRTVYDADLGRVRLDRVRQRQIEKWRDDQAPGLSKASINRNLNALKAALNHAAERRYVTADHAIEWKNVYRLENAERRRGLYLDLKQRRALLAHAEGKVRDLIEGAMLTGARAGELVSARRSQFDPRTGILALHGKTGERKIPLNKDALRLFKRLGKGKLPAAYLFTRDDGNPWAHSDWDGLIRGAAKKAALPAGVCLYTLRHSFITAAILGGLTPLEVARLTGTSLAMIDKHYGHLALTAARERLAELSLV